MSASITLLQTAHNSEVIRELGERKSDMFFPVSLRPLNECLTSTGPHGFVDSNNKWNVVTNDDTGDIIAVHKDKYRLQKNKDVFEAFDAALASHNLDLTGLKVRDELAYNGGRATRTYRMPAHRVDIGDGDPVDLMLKVQNSYDGSRRFGMNFGAFRILCSNGLVIGNNMCEVKAKHTDGLDIAAVTNHLANAIDVFIESTALWAQWRDTPCPDGIHQNVIETLPGISEAAKERISAFYDRAQHEHGRNVWTLYNALTEWSTHDEIKESARINSSAIIQARESKVRLALQHPVFQVAA